MVPPSRQNVDVLHSPTLLMQQLSHALVAAATTADENETPHGGPIGIGIILVAIGALAYSGKWRSWSTSRALIIYKVAPVALGWAGVGAIVGGAASTLPEPIEEIVGYPAVAFFLLCLIGMVRLPRFMLPRWYRIQKGLEPASHVGASRGARSADGALASGEGLGLVPPIGNTADMSLGTRVGGSVGGVGVAGPAATERAADEVSTPEEDAETSGSAGSPHA
jgi:hypothetical protein